MEYTLLLLTALVLPLGSAGESGSCPPTLPLEQCGAACGPDAKCAGAQLCCPTACGGALCTDPVTRRHFVDLVKPGRCPLRPGGPWVCSPSCTGDSDCARALKCCPNRCGARYCLKPDPDPYTTTTTTTTIAPPPPPPLTLEDNTLYLVRPL